MVTVLLILLQVYIVLGQATCEDEQDPTILPKSSYYATLRFCNLHISMDPVKGLPEIQYQSCTYSARRGLFFKWSDNSLAVVVPYESTYVIGIVPVDEVLKGKRTNATVEMSSNNVFRFIGLTAKTHPQTCHRLPKENKFICYALTANQTLIQTVYEFRNLYMIEDEVTIPLPSQGVYEPVLGSYVTEDGTSHVWIMHRSRVFYNINIEQYMKIGKAAMEAHRLEYTPKCNTINVLYADPGGLVTKCCYGIPQCFHRYHALRESKTLLSTCLLWTHSSITIAVVQLSSSPSNTTVKPRKQASATSDVEDKLQIILHEEQHNTYAHIPIQILAFATFVYLCFFFFFAFNPHRSSDLAELSAIVEEEIAQLSILTSKAVQSMKAEKQTNVAPAVLLMKRPEQSTQESLEEVRGTGETCNSWLCPHNRHHRDANKMVGNTPVKDPGLVAFSVNKDVPLSAISTSFNKMSQYGKSTTLSQSVDPTSKAQVKSIRQLNHTTTTGSGRRTAKPISVKKAGSTEQRSVIVKNPNAQR